MTTQQLTTRKALSDAAWEANQAWFKASEKLPQSDPVVRALWDAYLVAQQAVIDFNKGLSE